MDLEVEIFAVGKWNGMTFDVADLEAMAASHAALKEVHDVPLKFGHNKEQPITDGQPSLGWVEEVLVKGDKLFAKFIDMPKIVYDAMKAKLYKHVSIELDMGVNHKGNSYDLVLSGVALLGADIPAVNTLADLTNYMSKNEKLSFDKRVAFTAINIKQQTEEFSMNELEKAQAEIVALTAKKDALEESVINFSKGKVDSDTKIAEFEAKELADKKEAETAFFAKAKADLTTSLEDLVKSETITPAQREKFMADYKDEKGAIESMNFTLGVLAAGTKGTKGMDSNEDANNTNVNKDDEGKEPDEILMTRISKLQEKDTTLNFTSARNIVFKAEPELAQAYRDMNGGS